ncbi:3'-tRNA processing endoribonuclease [Metarhizium album ARSEF 1941]|uniref:3'-tRNA processing endoribonuclease n=1 Tax=Metarhizium album (strain ARSEF 1941) TaxID=1081103 RepID=A0A0B2WD20_METAS|nr:3'-tRNA processing endoribonuclease [Metarhizium album ARSEF 1941]KHN93721.1 3'-tRNA processing endoribonuclease [Metarhizium album ARSEF 1941]
MGKIAFATPLPQSTRSEVLEWKFPKPHDHLVLTGRSRAAWHTSFIIPQLNLLLDAGLCVNKQRPKHIFLTHGHADHTLLAFAFVTKEDPPDIYCPAEMKHIFDSHILSTTMMNLGGLVGTSDAEQQGFAVDEANGGAHADGRTPQERALLNTHVTRGVKHGDTVPLRRHKGITASVFNCDHTVPCVGYVFSSSTARLKREYRLLPGPQLKHLRQSGVEITEPHSATMFAFLGDTTIATLAAAPAWLRDGIPVVITECSFLYEDHAAQADKTKHTKWSDLAPVIRRWPRTTFVLTHFSMRYSDRQVCRFFMDLEDAPPNMVIWADPEE